MAEIKVPKPPKNAFNPERPASDLLKSQVEHLEWAVRNAGERLAALRPDGGRLKYKTIKTEADASARMATLVPRLSSAAELPFATSEIPDDQETLKPPPRRKTSRPRRKPARAKKVAARRKTKAKAKTKSKSKARAKR